MEKRLKMYSHQLALEYEDPPIVSAAVFLRGGPSGVEKREVVSQLGPVVTNRFYYVAFGLSGSLAEEFVERPQPLAGALAALMGSKIWDRVDKKMACFEAVQRADVDDEKRYLLKSVVENYVELDEEEQKRFAAKLKREEHKEVRKMVQTWQEARETWEARGEARGEVKAARKAIVRLAKHRHGSVPPEFVEKLETVDDTERLYHILEQVTEVPSLAQIDFGS